MVKCKNCGKEFEGRSNKIYCSKRCGFIKRNKKWRDNHTEQNREIQRKSAKKYGKRRSDYQIKWRSENKEKQKAYDRLRKASLKGIRKDVCSYCGSIDKLIFHHTNYEKDEGITLCEKCHKNLHKIKYGFDN
jgi:hypothetical protein